MVGVWDRVHPQHVHRCSKMERGANVPQSFSMIQQDCNKLENSAEETPDVQQEKTESPVFEERPNTGIGSLVRKWNLCHR